MNWDAIAAVAELAAALGVIASLIYLAVQIRHNTAAVRAENLRGLVGSLATAFDRITADPVDRALYLRGRESIRDLSSEEQERFWTLLAFLLANLELARDLYRDGLVKPGTYEASMRALALELSHPGVRQMWEQRKLVFANDFQEFVEERLRASDLR